MKNPWVVVGIITGVLIVGAVLFSNTVDKKNNKDIEIISHVKGDQEAKVKLVEYSDFQCPACAGFEPILQAIFEQAGDNISFEFKQFPLSLTEPTSILSALAAEAAGQQGKFFEYYDLLFENQLMWSTSVTPNVHFAKFAEDLDLNVELFKKHMSSSLLLDKIKADREEGIALGVTGTPSFFLNGEKMKITSYEDFIRQILVAVDPDFAISTSTEESVNIDGVKFGI